MMDTASEAAAEQSAGVQVSPVMQSPSTWSAVWVAGALAWLIFARKSFGRLG